MENSASPVAVSPLGLTPGVSAVVRYWMGRVLLERVLQSAASRGFRLATAIMYEDEAGFYTAAGWQVVDNKVMVGVTVGPGPAGIAWRPLDPHDSRLRLAFQPLHPQVTMRHGLASPQETFLLDGVVPKRDKHVDADEVQRLTALASGTTTAARPIAGDNRAFRRAARGHRQR